MTGEVESYYHRVQPYLDLELADRGDDEFWTWIASRAGSRPGAGRVLEVGAGTGRATAFLARRAGEVVAFELAPELAGIARRRLRGTAGVRILVADMRRFHLAARFDLAVAIDDPFSHLTRGRDRDRALARIAAHLVPGGLFVLDAAWLPPNHREAAEGAGLTLDSTHREGSAELQVRQHWRCDASTGNCRVRFEYSRHGQPLERATFSARLWSHDEIERRFARAGLELVELWGDYDRRPWDRNGSPRMIAAAARPESGRSIGTSVAESGSRRY
jgi:SAM-dependent methyltransferase